MTTICHTMVTSRVRLTYSKLYDTISISQLTLCMSIEIVLFHFKGYMVTDFPIGRKSEI